jgi:hypothetical protein
MDSASPSFSSFEEFWPFYVGQHSKPGTRILHFAGTTVGLAALAAAIVTARPVCALWGLVASYGLAWIGHFAIEKNRPATFAHPIWSLYGDFRMYALMWRGQMSGEAQRLMLSPSPAGRGSG